MCQVVNESAANESTLVTTVIDAEAEQDAMMVEDSQIDTPPSASGFKRFKKRVWRMTQQLVLRRYLC